MRTPEEIQARINTLIESLPKTAPRKRNLIRLEIYSLQWSIGHRQTAPERFKSLEWANDRLPSKIIKNQLKKEGKHIIQFR